jgi:Tfp pilus assembly protein PilP
MRKILIFIMALGILGWAGLSSADQASGKTDNPEIRSAPQTKEPTYSPAGRRDPFKDLLAGKDIKNKGVRAGVPQLYIDDITLIGISKKNNIYAAIINGPQGFPYTLRAGDKLSDGFVLSISDMKVVFRKTQERGFPLMKPKDITKEINPEGR